jgi:hypothetical protein
MDMDNIRDDNESIEQDAVNLEPEVSENMGDFSSGFEDDLYEDLREDFEGDCDCGRMKRFMEAPRQTYERLNSYIHEQRDQIRRLAMVCGLLVGAVLLLVSGIVLFSKLRRK